MIIKYDLNQSKKSVNDSNQMHSAKPNNKVSAYVALFFWPSISSPSISLYIEDNQFHNFRKNKKINQQSSKFIEED